MNEPGTDQAAVEALEAFIGTWTMEAVFPSDPATVMAGGRSVFEWLKGGHVLVQRTEVPGDASPDSICVVSGAAPDGTYVQHFFDSRGVVRLYKMTLREGEWMLLRDAADFSALDFAQRFTGSFNAAGDTIQGQWETSTDGATWTKDFDLTYRRTP